MGALDFENPIFDAGIVTAWQTRVIDGTLAAVRVHEDVVETYLDGVYFGACAEWITPFFDEVLDRHGTTRAYHDWENVSRVTTSARLHWQSWLRRSGGRIVCVRALIGIPLLRMAFSVANLAYSSITFESFAERSDYERERDLVMPRAPRPERPERSGK